MDRFVALPKLPSNFPFHSAATVLTPRKNPGRQSDCKPNGLGNGTYPAPYPHTPQYLSFSLPNLSQAGRESISSKGPSDHVVSSSLGVEGGVLAVFLSY